MSYNLVARIVTMSLLLFEINILLLKVTGSKNSFKNDGFEYHHTLKSHHHNYFHNQHRHQHDYGDGGGSDIDKRAHHFEYNIYDNKTKSISILNDKNNNHFNQNEQNYMMPVKHRHAKRRNRNFEWHFDSINIHHTHSSNNDRTDSRLFIDMDTNIGLNGVKKFFEPEPHWPVKKESIMEGDLILGGLMMVHSREESIMCGSIMPQGGIQALEAMLYTLDRINEDKILLPNITIGAHILDDCDRDSYGLEMAVDFIKGTCLLNIIQSIFFFLLIFIALSLPRSLKLRHRMGVSVSNNLKG